LKETLIGTQNERSLHKALKEWYALPGDDLEVKVDGSVIDLVRGDLLIEIQTRNFSAIRSKLRTLTERHKLRLIYPIALEKWITRLDAQGNSILGKRKSPKRGDLMDLFDELVAVPELIDSENLELEVLLIREEEVRWADGKGSWWRRGHSVRDRKLIQVVETVHFRTQLDFLRFFPTDLTRPFTNKNLARATGRPIHQVRRMTYCLKKMGLILPVGKNKNELLFELAIK
jgi:hypothetical protein